MEDPDLGAEPPQGGASRDFPPAGGGSPSGSGQVARPPESQSANGQASRDAPHRKPKKRRKRKRGRKVFARDALPGAGPAPERAGAPAIVVPLPELAPAAGSAGGVLREPLAPAASYFPPRGGGFGEAPVFAALDLGTNNCRLLVAVPARPGQFRVIDAFSRIVRLGEGLSATGRLNDAAMDRALDALKVCAEKLGSREIRRARLIATEACRSASNGSAFLARVQAETGLVLEVIDRKTEARLAVSGCGSLIERDTEGVVLFDIGGGSSEIALIDLSRARSHHLARHIKSWTSLPVGVVSLAERFGGRDVTREIFSAMVDEVTELLMAFEGRNLLSHLMKGSRFHLLGTSGTVTTLAGVHLGLERYDRRRVDGLWMDGSHVDAMVEKLLGWEFHERVANPCIGADRADLVLAGCAILEAIRRVWPAERLRVADRGLREGMLTELMAEDGVWRRRRGMRS